MGYTNQYVNRPGHRRSTVIIIILTVLLAAVLAICVWMAMTLGYFGSVQEPASSTPSSEPEPEPASSEPLSAAVSEEERPESEPLPPGEPPESDPVDQSYFDDAAFFGDSITAGIGVYAVMSNADVIAVTGANPVSVMEKANYSPPGSEERLTMIEALRRSDPKKIYIQLGANWVGERSGIEQTTFIGHYRALLETIRAEHPDSIIYVQSMFPVSRAYDANENGKNTYGLTNALIRDYNQALHDLAVETGNYYLDLYSVLSDEDGYLPDEETSDGMHLKAEYYEMWFDYLKTHAIKAEDEDSALQSQGDISSAESEISAPPPDNTDNSEVNGSGLIPSPQQES